MSRISVSWLSVCLVCLSGSQSAIGQHHHHHHAEQKNPAQKGEGENESAPLPGGYQAPPRSGVQEGATGGIRLNGPTLEIPSLRITLPHLGIPGVTQFRTPAQMLLKEAVAPFVNDVRNEVSFESGALGGVPESTPLQQGQPESSPLQQPVQQETGLQKVSHSSCPECERNGAPSSADLEARVDSLQRSVDRLISVMEQVQRQPPNASVEHQSFERESVPFPVQQSHYQRIEKLPRPAPALLRLPEVR